VIRKKAADQTKAVQKAKEGDTMLAKSLKFAMVFALVLAFFGGTAMADNRGRDGHHTAKWERGHQKHHVYKQPNHYRKHHQGDHYYARRDYGHRNPPRPSVHQPRYQVSKPHPLAPRIVFLGPIPVPVPPPPHEVLGYLAGHR